MHDDHHQDFPITRNWVYLNHALISPLPRRSLLASTKTLNRFSRSGPLSHKILNRRNSMLRQELAVYLSAPKENIALFRNISDAILFLRHRLPIETGRDILGIEIPPSQAPTWNLWKSRNLKVELTDHETFNSSDTLEQTALLALGPFLNCQPKSSQIAHYSQICKDNGTLFLADLSFLAGVHEISPTEMGVDIALIETHRWMLGVPDVVIMSVSNVVAKALRLSRSNNLSGFIEVPQNQSTTPNFTQSHLDSFDPSRLFDSAGSFASKAALLESLKLLNEVGLSEIKDRIYSIKIQVINGLREEGFSIVSDTLPGVVIAEHEKLPAQVLCEKLLTYDIQVGWKENQLWVSPHFYNTEIEIERLFKAIHTIINP